LLCYAVPLERIPLKELVNVTLTVGEKWERAVDAAQDIG
jgi:hypothetical protein